MNADRGDGRRQAWLVLSACAVLTVFVLAVAVPVGWRWVRGEMARSMAAAEAERAAREPPGEAPPPPDSFSIAELPVATADPATWISDADYPVDAMRNGQEGRVAVRLTFGADSLPGACAIEETSGVRSLNAAACGALLARARMVAAPGRPERTMRRAIVWRLPPA